MNDIEQETDVNKERNSEHQISLIGNEAVVHYLIEHGFVDTLLICACRSGNVTLIKYLVEQDMNINEEGVTTGIDITNVNIDGKTPLLCACKNEQGRVDINKKNKNHPTPLFYACKNRKVH
ncbi:hypothetical protein PIROE2DRAFT_13539 [Piromyces sp. E2]|nr:hypothetical protein PIROE2DRAFT_13539 [Piromyces sp. E2]|eukprot:OUM60634.1 hypothetical protein PIROE2DRAFT_13539 [Piromyces sp. E2]